MAGEVGTVHVPLEDGMAPMDIEHLPLVQAHALEGMGGHGFFTMHHTVEAANPLLATLYSEIDHPALDLVGHLLQPFRASLASTAFSIARRSDVQISSLQSSFGETVACCAGTGRRLQ